VSSTSDKRHPVLHPVTWVVWTAASTAVTMLTRNPMYISLVLGIVAIQYLLASQGQPDASGWQALVRIALALSLLIIPFNALGSHAGRHVLFRLPSGWPLIGGPITLEAAIWGACGALSLVTLIVLFAAFNLQMGRAEILRLTPAFVYEVGLIISIALTFVPQLVLSAREIREAQLIRGHRMRRIRDLLPFLVSLLTTALEHSFQLAESLEARGFGNVRESRPRSELLLKALTLLGLAGTLSGFVFLTYLDSLRAAGTAIVLLSVALLLGVFWAQGRRVRRTRYWRQRWTWQDGVVLLCVVAVVVALILARAGDSATLVYDPYSNMAPPFQPWLGLALLALVAPVIVRLLRPVRPIAH
jgi:energy-coupling factor transport system permease protein